MKYFAILTSLGAAKLANATALGTTVDITHIAVGDGGGKLPAPDTNQTKLINEKRRAAINTLSVDPVNTSQIIAEQIIPENEGGWWIREIGLFDSEGVMIAVANCPETYKPQLQEGSGRTQAVRMVLIVSSTDSVTLKIDPSVVLATREYVDSSIKKHEKSRNHPDATTKDKGVVKLNSAIDSNDETAAATPKAVKTAYDLAASKLSSVPDATLSQKGVVQLNSATNNASETQAATPKAVKAAYDLATTANNNVATANTNATNANNNANDRLAKNQNGTDIPDKNAFVKNLGLVETVNLAKNAVSSSRKINGKSLSNDINLSAEDVKAQPAGNYAVRGEIYTKSESDGRYQPHGNYQPAGNYAVRGESYTKSESDGKYQLKGRQLLGVNQSWVNVTSSRAPNTIYTNSTGNPIAVIIWSDSRAIAFKIGNVFVDSYSGLDNCTFIVPVGATYELVKGRLGTWIELR